MINVIICDDNTKFINTFSKVITWFFKSEGLDTNIIIVNDYGGSNYTFVCTLKLYNFENEPLWEYNYNTYNNNYIGFNNEYEVNLKDLKDYYDYYFSFDCRLENNIYNVSFKNEIYIDFFDSQNNLLYRQKIQTNNSYYFYIDFPIKLGDFVQNISPENYVYIRFSV